MDKILMIIKREFFTKIRSKFFIISTLLAPLIFIVFAIGPAALMSYSSSKEKSIVFVDNTDLLKEKLMKRFDDPKLKIKVIDQTEYIENEDHYRGLVEDKDIKSLVMIPEDAFEDGELIYYSSSLGDIEFINRIKSGVSSAISSEKMIKEGIDPVLVESLSKPIGLKTIKLEKGKKKEKSLAQDFITAYIFLLVLYMSLLLYANQIMSGVYEEKSSRVVEVMLSSCNTFQMMMGKLFGVGLVGIFQYSVWGIMIFSSLQIAKSTGFSINKFVSISPELFFFFVVFFILGFFQFSSIFMIAGAVCSNPDDLKQAATPATMLLIIPFFVSFGATKGPELIVYKILSHLPFFNPMLMLVRIAVASPSSVEILVSIVINILSTVFFVYICSRIYRVGILMFGKRPSIKELFRWIRYT